MAGAELVAVLLAGAVLVVVGVGERWVVGVPVGVGELTGDGVNPPPGAEPGWLGPMYVGTRLGKTTRDSALWKDSAARPIAIAVRRTESDATPATNKRRRFRTCGGTSSVGGGASSVITGRIVVSRSSFSRCFPTAGEATESPTEPAIAHPTVRSSTSRRAEQV